MSYTIYKSDGTPITVDDNAIDVAYYNSLGGGPYPGESGGALSGQGMGTQLIGRNTVDYGAAIAQNFLQMTENFASGSGFFPSDLTALQGQLWFNKSSASSGNLYVRTSGETSGGLANWNQLVTLDTNSNLTVPGSITATEFIGAISGNSSSATITTNLAGGAIGALPYQYGSGLTTFLSAVPAGSVLVSGIASPSWTNAPSISGANITGISTSSINGADITIGSTAIALGGTVVSLAGLNSVTSNSFTGTLNGVATGNLPITGGTLTGDLILASNPTAPLGAVTKQYVDAVAIGSVPYASISDAEAGVSTTLAINPYTLVNTITSMLPVASFTPVQQGGGVGQGTNKIYIGWGSNSQLMLQVDSTGFGSTWPMNITGNAAVATTANQLNSGNSYSMAGLAVTGDSYTNGRTFLSNGTAATPSLTFTNEPVQDTGLYWGGDGFINVTNNGVYSGQFTNDHSLVMVNNITTTTGQFIGNGSGLTGNATNLTVQNAITAVNATNATNAGNANYATNAGNANSVGGYSLANILSSVAVNIDNFPNGLNTLFVGNGSYSPCVEFAIPVRSNVLIGVTAMIPTGPINSVIVSILDPNTGNWNPVGPAFPGFILPSAGAAPADLSTYSQSSATAMFSLLPAGTYQLVVQVIGDNILGPWLAENSTAYVISFPG